MNTLNQNTILTSLETTLAPSSNLVDGRTESDWLSFMADFASLINFYDANNQIRGNWAPFLLKDPIIIISKISKTNVTKQHSIFLNSCLHIEALFKEDENNTKISELINSLFDQIFELFLKLEYWIRFLLKSNHEFSFKKYLFYQVEHVYSAQLWALLSLRGQLILNKVIAKVESIDFSVFQTANAAIWLLNKDKKPYWEILDLEDAFLKNKITDFINALKKTGNQLFTFITSITQHAKAAFGKLKETRSPFPDTILIRTFIQLLMHHRQQLNEISQKHLDFYYTKILKQNIKNAIPDSVFIALNLSKKNSAFLLPKNSLFDAGIDAQKNPIIFSSNENVSLNPATVASAKTLAAATVEINRTKLYLQDIITPSVLQKDETGKIEGWSIFGNGESANAANVFPGIAFASPLLYLKEGNRTIQVTITFNEAADFQFLKSASFYLSSKENWIAVSAFVQESSTSNSSIILNITLDNTKPSIETFTKNPDGYESKWPLLKIVFDSYINNISIPVINSVEFQVEVQNNSSLQLYNDFGALDPKKPFELFGPTPTINSSFIIGNNEIFSKPLQSLEIDMTWDTLPKSFQTYYQEYNTYLSNAIVPQNQLVPDTSKSNGFIKKTKNLIKKAVNVPIGMIKKLLNIIIKLLKEIIQLLKDILGISDPNATTPFNNTCFTVDFEILNNSKWKKFDMIKQGISVDKEGKITSIPYCVNEYCVPQADINANLLFSTDSAAKKCELTTKSFFSYVLKTSKTQDSSMLDMFQPIEPLTLSEKAVSTTIDPNIQNSELLFTEKSDSGFLKMTLSGPNPYGFGFEIYPEIVANTALENALEISKTFSNSQKIAAQPKLPFAPKLKTITANYCALQKYDLTKSNDFPLQCYTYSSFINYLTYDTAAAAPVFNYNVGDNNISNSQAKGIPIMPALYNYKGFLYIELEDVIAPNVINFYIELGRKEGNIPTDTKPDYYYLSASGWQPLPILSDGTNNLSCSGIITFNFPHDISNQTSLMNSKNYWICLATKSDISNYPEITFLKTNGVLLTRSGSEYLFDTTEPKINSDTISKSHIAIPEIAYIVQPFPSFDGKAMENDSIKNKRISNRLKTKDRIVSLSDYYSVIQQEFNDIYFSKAIYKNKEIIVYVVKKSNNVNDYNAFAPLISICSEEKIQRYLETRTSAFTAITVRNFSFLTVTVNATITVANGYEFQGVQKTLQAALKLFLSPWISTNSPQITIGENLSADDVIHFIRTIEGVSNVDKLTFNTSRLSSNGDLITQTDLTLLSLDDNPELIIASNINHIINERD